MIQCGFGSMHLDDWVAPEEIVQPVGGSESDRRLMALLVAGNNNWIGSETPTEANAVFEVSFTFSLAFNKSRSDINWACVQLIN